ncbi:MAG: protein kinase, partial [Clostridia bacterium]|nr:protein kinase [Clostridia bacterium]
MSDHGNGIRTDDIRPGALLDGGWRVIGKVSENQWDGTRFRVRSESTGCEACLFVPAEKERPYVTKVLDKYRAWSRLPAHPNILSCLEVREEQASPMLLYEWTEGRSLMEAADDQSLRNCPADAAAARVMDAAIQSLRGLQFLHERGWVHADVKPENMLVTRDGILKLDRPGLLRGAGMTPAFASPEQAEGNVLPASDLYSWAVSLIYLVLGKREWRSGEELSGQPDRVMELLVSAPVTLPPLMLQLITECLSPQAEMRPKDDRLTLLMLEKIYRARFGRDYSAGQDLKGAFPKENKAGDPGATVFAHPGDTDAKPEDPGATVFAPSGDTDEKPEDPGATVFAPSGYTHAKPEDPGATVFAPSGDADTTHEDPGATVFAPSGDTDEKPEDPGAAVFAPPDKAPAGGLDDLLSGLESAARERMHRDDRKPAQKAGPASAMDDLLSGLENAARQRMNGPRRQESAEGAAPDVNYTRGSVLLDAYRIESDPIHGGMGSVWRVRHTEWNTDLAMKRPQPQMFADDASKRNFINECQCWIDLGLHPNIVSCYYVREIDGVPAIFSEWMENGSLENRIQDGSLYAGTDAEQQARLMDIAIQYARGLHYAHEQGLIHQDVKPDNLLLTKDYQAKAADFGLARARAVLTVREQPANDGATHMAASGGYTPAYCSMEQMDGKPLTRRTDIYSWAVSVMEMYLGGRPWQNGVVAGMSCRSYF